MSYIFDLNKQEKQKSVLKWFHFISWSANIKDHLNYMCPHFTSMQMTLLYSTLLFKQNCEIQCFG